MALPLDNDVEKSRQRMHSHSIVLSVHGIMCVVYDHNVSIMYKQKRENIKPTSINISN